MKKVVVITGAGRGIGREVAVEFGNAGYGVVLISRSKDQLNETAKLIEGQTQVISADISNKDQVAKVFDEIRKEFKKIHVLINAAGVQGPIGLLQGNAMNLWDETIAINLLGTVYCMHKAIPLIIEAGRGSIINFSGGGALTPRANFSAYATSKAAIVRLTETVAQELKPWKIRVNAISPGGVNTAMFIKMIEAGQEKVGKEEWVKLQKQKETGGNDPKLAAKLCLWLAEEKSKPLTGKTISAVYDDWQNWNPEQIKKFAASDWLTMRRLDQFTLDKFGKI